MHLPQHVYAMFQEKPLKTPTEPLPMPDANVLESHPLSGVAHFLNRFEQYDRRNPPPHKATVIRSADILREEARAQKRRRVAEIRSSKRADHDSLARKRAATWDPNAEADRKTGDAYNTLFVANLKRKTTEDQIREHFDKFGEINKIIIVSKMNYAFVEFAREEDFMSALKDASKMLNGKRVVIDIERGRTVKDWKPKLLGGGISSRSAPAPGSSRAGDYRGGSRRW
eukprot:CAMPEP_0171491618 /NCGR_PEP_ID=MMETSP0958-20121227/3956_1 /TAXON_ID=87120 /ORGANISM="Aurantiochytrium limacinum, Strain ATCCMYA-1381" /LENGTH=226 /DNA_ID=CAMNT_0012025049 /DNA_START=140 /DNA_END=820 /DNA_ORIENTATION=+